MSVPRLLHQIWIGPRPIPEREQHWCAEMAKMNPTWKHTLHGNEVLTRYVDDPYIKVMQERQMSLAFISDRLRILLLRDEGGVYLDADCEPIRPLDSMQIWDRSDLDFVAGLRSPFRKDVALHRAIPLVDNTFMASAKNGHLVSKIASLWSPEHIVIDGHSTGCAVLENADHTTILLNHRYIYAMEKFPENLVLHDFGNRNLGSWAKPKNFLAPAAHGLA